MSESKNRNPYVGPRTFDVTESDRFFGRDREADDLFSLVVSNQLVLFYAQSGAGKSSLINANLIPRLKKHRFEVLPVARIGGSPPDGVKPENVFAYNVMVSIDQKDDDNSRFHTMSLSDFLDNLIFTDGLFHFDSEAELPDDDIEIVPRLLIIDQFEEIVTNNLAAWPQRADFFKQLRQAMEDDPYLWVLLVIREDYAAALDPYAHLLPGQLQTRYYMQRMKMKAAIEAINQPMSQYGNGRSFAPGVAEALAANLSQIRGRDGAGTQSGEFIEPVQLQVVCYQLWENLGSRTGPITEADLETAGDVDAALAQFYDQALQNVVDSSQGKLTQLQIRNWIEQKLITESQKRGIVSQGSEQTAGLANEHVQNLQNQFLLRSTQRAGSTWYELVHDRFVDPILQSNQAWRTRQGEVLLAAEAWQENEKDNKSLYKGFQLVNALSNEGKRTDLEPLVREFLDASKAARRKRFRRRFLYAGLGVVIIGFFLIRWAVNLEPYVTAVAFTNDGSDLVVSTYYDDLFFYDLSDLGSPERRMEHNNYVTVAVVSEDGERLATGSFDNTIRLWDLTDPDRPSELLEDDSGATIRHLAFSPDGQQLASVEIYGNSVKLWAIEGESPFPDPQELETGFLDEIIYFEFSPDGENFVAVDKEQRVFLWQLSNLEAGPTFLLDTND